MNTPQGEEYSAHDWRAATSGTARSSYLARVGPVSETTCFTLGFDFVKRFCFKMQDFFSSYTARQPVSSITNGTWYSVAVSLDEFICCGLVTPQGRHRFGPWITMLIHVQGFSNMASDLLAAVLPANQMPCLKIFVLATWILIGKLLCNPGRWVIKVSKLC